MSQTYSFHEETPSAEEYNALREIIGWGALDEEVVRSALLNSVYGVVAKHDGRVIGFARMVGDGGLCYYIQEIIILPEYQQKGIGSMFMEHIMAFLRKNASFRAYIGVFVGKELRAFYRRYGFWERPTKEMGPGMMQFWNDAEFNERLSEPE